MRYPFCFPFRLHTRGPLTRVPWDLLFLHASVQGAVGVAPLKIVWLELTWTYYHIFISQPVSAPLRRRSRTWNSGPSPGFPSKISIVYWFPK